MGFQILSSPWKPGLHDLSRQQHSTGLSSDGAASCHPVPQEKIIPGVKIFFDHFLQPGILCHSTLDNLLLGPLGKPSLPVLHPGHREKPVIAVQALILLLYLFLFQKLVITAHGHSILHRPEVPAPGIHAMRQKHSGCIAVPDLQRMQVKLLSRMDIQKKLRSITDPGNGMKGVLSPQQWKISHCIQLKKIGTGNAEKVSHHQVCIPH